MLRNGPPPTSKKKFEQGGLFSLPSKNIAGLCSKCKTEIPQQSGFRQSALKCPKCGGDLAKK